MGFGSGMGWASLFWLLLVLGVVLLVVVAVRVIGGGVGPGGADRSGNGSPQVRSSARQLLDERYARGDITTEEYQERLRALGENR